MARANATEFGLAAGVFTKDFPRATGRGGVQARHLLTTTPYNDAPAKPPFGAHEN